MLSAPWPRRSWRRESVPLVFGAGNLEEIVCGFSMLWQSNSTRHGYLRDQLYAAGYE